MTFEKYCNEIIENFIEDVNSTLKIDLTQDQKDNVYTILKQHEGCFEKEYESFCKEDSEMIASVIDDNESVSIKCMNCNKIIINSDSLFLG